jgi:DUF917 family protein
MKLTKDNLEALCLGASVLGSGGGGNPVYKKLIVAQQLERFGPITIVSADDLRDDDLVVPFSTMGAPLVALERILSGKEFPALYAAVTSAFGKAPAALMAAEIGGSNALTPFMVAGELGLPVLDADLMGRAFPELQMSSAELKKIPATPAFLADAMGNTVIFNTNDAFTLERMARAVTVAAGSTAAVAIYLLTGKLIKAGAAVGNTVSRALDIGTTILAARAQGADVVRTVAAHCGGTLVGFGSITDINHTVAAGFLRGTVTIDNAFEVEYQNEYLVLKHNGVIQATTPDMIVLLEQETGTPIGSESLTYGLRVGILVLSAPLVWQSPEGLALIGPRVFGYDYDYVRKQS